MSLMILSFVVFICGLNTSLGLSRSKQIPQSHILSIVVMSRGHLLIKTKHILTLKVKLIVKTRGQQCCALQSPFKDILREY